MISLSDNSLELSWSAVPDEDFQYYNLESGCEELFSVLNQISEVSKVEWKTCQQAIKSMRPYNIEKQLIMRNVDKLLKSNKLYQ